MLNKSILSNKYIFLFIKKIFLKLKLNNSINYKLGKKINSNYNLITLLFNLINLMKN